MQTFLETTFKTADAVDRLMGGLAHSRLVAQIAKLADGAERRGLVPPQKMIKLLEADHARS